MGIVWANVGVAHNPNTASEGQFFPPLTVAIACRRLTVAALFVVGGTSLIKEPYHVP